MALPAPELDVRAVTTSAGKQTPGKTFNNALRILALLGWGECDSGCASSAISCFAARFLYHCLVAGLGLYQWVQCPVDIETVGGHTCGMMVVDRHGLTGKPANVLVLPGLVSPGFIELLVTRLRAFD